MTSKIKDRSGKAKLYHDIRLLEEMRAYIESLKKDGATIPAEIEVFVGNRLTTEKIALGIINGQEAEEPKA